MEIRLSKRDADAKNVSFRAGHSYGFHFVGRRGARPGRAPAMTSRQSVQRTLAPAGGGNGAPNIWSKSMQKTIVTSTAFTAGTLVFWVAGCARSDRALRSGRLESARVVRKRPDRLPYDVGRSDRLPKGEFVGYRYSLRGKALRYLILDGAPTIKVPKGQWRRWLVKFFGVGPLRGAVLLRFPSGKLVFTLVNPAAAGACIFRRRHDVDVLVVRRRLRGGKWVGIPGAKFGRRPPALLSAVGTVGKCGQSAGQVNLSGGSRPAVCTV